MRNSSKTFLGMALECILGMAAPPQPTFIHVLLFIAGSFAIVCFVMIQE